MSSLNRDQICYRDDLVTIRPVQPGDAPQFVDAINESLEQLKPWMSFAQEPATLEDLQTWIEKQPDSWERGINYAFAIREATPEDPAEPVLLGGCGLNSINPVHRIANLVYWVRSSRSGQGIASRVVPMLARFGFLELKLTRIEIVVGTDNAASLRVAQKAGARREGVLRNRILIGEVLQEAVMHSLIPGDLGL
jgi:RimJ/RimL family protein N-acetyltransferase